MKLMTAVTHTHTRKQTHLGMPEWLHVVFSCRRTRACSAQFWFGLQDPVLGRFKQSPFEAALVPFRFGLFLELDMSRALAYSRHQLRGRGSLTKLLGLHPLCSRTGLSHQSFITVLSPIEYTLCQVARMSMSHNISISKSQETKHKDMFQ